MLDIIRERASGWGVKILFGLIILVFVFWGVGSMTGSREQVVAYVDEEPITAQEFAEAYEQSIQMLRQQNPDITAGDLAEVRYKEVVLSQLVNTRLLENEADRLGISVSPVELRYAIAIIPAFQNEDRRFDPERYKLMLTRNRQTPGQFESAYRLDMLAQKLQEYVQAPAQPTEGQARDLFDYANEKTQMDYVLVKASDFRSQARPADAEMKAFYDQNKDQFMQPPKAAIEYALLTTRALADPSQVSEEDAKAFYRAHKDDFRQEEMVKARHILFQLPEGAGDKEAAEAKSKAEKVKAKLKAGADFEELAREHSEGPSASEGGDLGWFGRGQMVGPFEEAAFSLAPGETSAPVRTRFGIHLIKVEDRKEPGPIPFDQAEGDIKDMLAEERAADEVTRLLDDSVELLASGMDFSEIASSLELTVKSSEPMTKEELQGAFGMTPEAAETLFALPEGRTLDMPLSVENGYILARKNEEVPATELPFSEVRDRIAEAMTSQRAFDLAREDAENKLGLLTSSDAAEADLKNVRSRIRTSEPFSRQGFIPNVGSNSKLASDVFAAKDDSWLGQVYRTEQGYVVARADQRIPASDEEWQEQKDVWLDTLAKQKRQEYFSAFMRRLQNQAKVQIVRPDILE